MSENKIVVTSDGMVNLGRNPASGTYVRVDENPPENVSGLARAIVREAGFASGSAVVERVADTLRGFLRSDGDTALARRVREVIDRPSALVVARACVQQIIDDCSWESPSQSRDSIQKVLERMPLPTPDLDGLAEEIKEAQLAESKHYGMTTFSSVTIANVLKERLGAVSERDEAERYFAALDPADFRFDWKAVKPNELPAALSKALVDLRRGFGVAVRHALDGRMGGPERDRLYGVARDLGRLMNTAVLDLGMAVERARRRRKEGWS